MIGKVTRRTRITNWYEQVAAWRAEIDREWWDRYDRETTAWRRPRTREDIDQQSEGNEMARLRTSKAGGDFQPAPEGTHQAICYMSVDMGTQTTQWGERPQIFIGWELPEELRDDGKPFIASRMYNNSIGTHYESVFKTHLEAWRGKKFTEEEIARFDSDRLVGTHCLLTITHNTVGDRTYANVVGVTALPKGMEKAKPVNPPVIWNFETSTRADFDALGTRLQDKIVASPEWKIWVEHEHKPKAEEIDDDLPF